MDLGCYYRLRNGRQTLIDSLQFSRMLSLPRTEVSRQGCFTQPPYIWHSGDDKGGTTEGGETILVNPEGIGEIESIIIYTFIYEGAKHWGETQLKLTISVPGQENVTIDLGGQDSKKRFCALAQIDIQEDNSLAITRLCTFHEGHSDCDAAYGWGFNYQQRHK